MVSYQTTRVAEQLASNNPVRARTVHEWNGKAVKLYDGIKPGEQLEEVFEANGTLMLKFRFAEYVDKKGHHIQVTRNRMVLCGQQWHKDLGDFVWQQNISMVLP